MVGLGIMVGFGNFTWWDGEFVHKNMFTPWDAKLVQSNPIPWLSLMIYADYIAHKISKRKYYQCTFLYLSRL